MKEYILYHNSHCSKSRNALTILEDHSIKPAIINYLETPPDKKTLKGILIKLNMSARELMRKGEDEYKTLDLANQALSEDQLIDAMIKHPKLIERPILVVDDRAVIGRPPEKVLELIK